MRFVIVRSGLGEAIHDVDVYAVDAAGNELLSSGEPDHPMYYRSAVKPFQATIAIEAGLQISPEHQLGLISGAMREALSEVAEPTVFGGGRPVGTVTRA